MELLDLLRSLLRRKWVIVATVIFSVTVALVGSLLVTPIYTAYAMIRVPGAPNPLIDRTDVNYTDRVINTYTIIAKSKPVLQNVIDELDLDVYTPQLNEMIEVNAIEETELIRIKVSGSNPKQIADIANALANALIAESQSRFGGSQSATEAIQVQITQVQDELSQLRGEYDRLLIESPGETVQIAELNRAIVIKQQTYETLLSQYDQARLREAIQLSALTLVEPASEPGTPTTPRKSLNVALGGILGLVGGVGLVLLLNNIDKKLYTPHQIQTIVDLPILAEIQRVSKSEIKLPDMAVVQREDYRRLRANIFALQKDRILKTVMVASASPDEGKSTITANLAMSIAQLRHNVLVIDCDLRQPSQHKLFDLPNDVGLSTVLMKKVSLIEAIQQTHTNGVHVLTSGAIPDNPTELLSSSFFADILRELTPRYDVILLDTPPVIPVVDAAVLAPLVDGVLQVVRIGQSREDTMLATLSQIMEVQARPIGIVLNDAPMRPATYYTTAAELR